MDKISEYQDEGNYCSKVDEKIHDTVTYANSNLGRININQQHDNTTNERQHTFQPTSGWILEIDRCRKNQITLKWTCKLNNRMIGNGRYHHQQQIAGAMEKVKQAKCVTTAPKENIEQKKNPRRQIETNKANARNNDGYQQFIKSRVLNGSISSAIPDPGASLSAISSNVGYKETGGKSDKESQSAF